MPKKTTAQIIASGNNYIIQVKKNQPKLYEQASLNTQEDKLAVDVFEETTHKRGRKEYRKTFVYNNIEGVSPDWIGLKRLIRVERLVVCKTEKRHETSYYISSLRSNNAQKFAKHIRAHWGIENGLHWVKDVSMKEDSSKTAKGKAAENISIMRNIAINLFRVNGRHSIKEATQLYANNFKELWNLIRCNTKNKKRT